MATSLNSPLPRGGAKDADSGKKYKWDVKAGGSYVPQVPSVAKKEAQQAPLFEKLALWVSEGRSAFALYMYTRNAKRTCTRMHWRCMLALTLGDVYQRDAEQHRVTRKWEVKFAPQLATATRKVTVTSSDIKDFMNQFSDESQLRTAMGGASSNQTAVGNENEVPKPKAAPVAQRSAAPPRPPADEEPPQQDRPPEEEEEEEEDDDEEEEDEEDEDGGDAAYRGVPPAGVVEGLMMMLTSPDATEKAKAAAALCNICSETDSNRELVVHAGGLPSLIDMLKHPYAPPRHLNTPAPSHRPAHAQCPWRRSSSRGVVLCGVLHAASRV